MNLSPPPRKLKFPEYRLTLSLEKYLTVSDSCGSFVDAQKLIYEWYKKELPANEVMIAICLDGRNRAIGIIPVARGGAHGIGLKPSDIFKPVLTAGADAFILAHNHPSGDPTPSIEDIEMTKNIIEGSVFVGCPILDHIVITMDNKSRSLCDFVDFK